MPNARACIVTVLACGLIACSGPVPSPAESRATGERPAAAEPPAARTAGAGSPAAAPAATLPAATRTDAAAPSAFDGAAIPARFHGIYATQGQCDRAGAEGGLVIEAGAVRFHESRGPVIRAHGDGDTLRVTLALSGEGETREADYAFRREADGARLVDTRNGMARVRCARPASG